MTMKIRAAVAREHDRPLTVEELELDDLRANVVVKPVVKLAA